MLSKNQTKTNLRVIKPKNPNKRNILLSLIRKQLKKEDPLYDGTELILGRDK